MKWSNNNRACKTLWSTLRATDQISRSQTFSTTGDLKMKDLTFYAGTQGTVQLRAEALASLMDNIFIEIRKAEYEATYKTKKARAEMVGLLTKKDTTVAELSDVVDDAYDFLGEDA